MARKLKLFCSDLVDKDDRKELERRVNRWLKSRKKRKGRSERRRVVDPKIMTFATNRKVVIAVSYETRWT